ncbi:hypothetical protein AMIS_31100 [Actinoplanes missouriensis 431]|uniref:Uncharacterized protein n=1 Tax=Actinoplanes missouriensis (strain ATCC 14538 / DSM 43046 / CBS 188.64 / JCM 3121 / NBRC 102363 / NCIMB 12654 / NRRL B-3342 / UNCC 431) TaxID=512565 RepID=I0H5P3_ACTM4|nr:hypothetical protein AMIS_31100 [Actinoplanes missouriensis 431]
MWVESAPELAPGTIGFVRLAPLAPLAPLDWRDLQAGQSITMHEGTHPQSEQAPSSK